MKMKKILIFLRVNIFIYKLEDKISDIEQKQSTPYIKEFLMLK